MRIIEIKLKNFKIFSGEHIIRTDSPVVCLVGENNTGKTTVFAAVDFLKNGVQREKSIDDYKNRSLLDSPVSVEITIEGNLRNVIENFSETRYLPYIFQVDSKERIRLKRSSEKQSIKQNGKDVHLDEKKLTIYNPETDQFENPIGFDKAIGSLLEIQFIWFDMQPDDVVDFSTTKTLGRLLKEISSDFQESADWKSFLEAHSKAFESGDDALLKRAGQMRKDIQSALGDFYGNAEVEFRFSPPDPSSFIKLGEVLINDGIKTPISEKGSGMQRSLALAVIKVYADLLARHEKDSNLAKPIFFFIDEPEISLHPKAQAVLVDALHKISERQQVFITTHSPLFLKCLGLNRTAISVFSRDRDAISTKAAETANTFSFSPTLSEIIFSAYDLPTEEFHNELYAHICEVTKSDNSTKLDTWLKENAEISLEKEWIRIKNGGYTNPQPVSLMTYIRHSIHHPENNANQRYTEEELRRSIQTMLNIIKSDTFSSLKEE